jgi:hypothetical protein
MPSRSGVVWSYGEMQDLMARADGALARSERDAAIAAIETIFAALDEADNKERSVIRYRCSIRPSIGLAPLEQDDAPPLHGEFAGG